MIIGKTHTVYYKGGSYVLWFLPTIWKAAENLEVIKVHCSVLEKYNKTVSRFFKKDDFDRIEKVDLSFPLIIPPTVLDPNDDSLLIDGYHRLYKHFQLGNEWIECQVMDKLPLPDKCHGTPFKVNGLEFDWLPNN